MNLSLTDELEQYRERVKSWLTSVLPDWWSDYLTRTSDRTRYEDFLRSWDTKLYEGGFSGISWPKEYGGQGRGLLEEIVFEEEAGRLHAPRGINFLGKILLGPTLLAYGTEEQKLRFLPPLIRGEEIWCQGFSEPNAGSDLASLQTKAELDGDSWVINGQKVWTTEAHHANWCFVLARTDKNAPKHKGITYFLVPMNLPGITVRPLKKLSGDSDFNEVFFDNVRIPKDSYVGRLNEGWKVAMTTLSFERGILALGRQTRFQKEFDNLVKRSSELYVSGSSVKENLYFRQKIAQAYLELRIMRYHGLKTTSKFIYDGKLGPEASLQKLYWSEMHSRFGKLLMEVQGKDTALMGEDSVTGGQFQHIYFTTRGETIYAGTSQIQKNIIAEMVLGLPK